MLSLRRRRKYQTSDPTIILWQMGSLDSVQGKAGIRQDGNWHALYVASWQWVLGTIHIKIYESFPLCKVTRHYLLDAIMNWVKMLLSIDIFSIYLYFLGGAGEMLGENVTSSRYIGDNLLMCAPPERHSIKSICWQMYYQSLFSHKRILTIIIIIATLSFIHGDREIELSGVCMRSRGCSQVSAVTPPQYHIFCAVCLFHNALIFFILQW